MCKVLDCDLYKPKDYEYCDDCTKYNNLAVEFNKRKDKEEKEQLEYNNI